MTSTDGITTGVLRIPAMEMQIAVDRMRTFPLENDDSYKILDRLRDPDNAIYAAVASYMAGDAEWQVRLPRIVTDRMIKALLHAAIDAAERTS